MPRSSSTSVALFGLLFILALLVVPVPRGVVDVGLILSFGCGLLLLSSTLRARTPLELSTFPALVLLATLLRLGLNVATTRWILSTGDGGAVVRAFGEFAAAGDPLVGAAVFIVITILLVVVVSKGSERVAEVAARFSLDGLPGRQMSVDADMRAGVIDFEQARTRREELLQETRLYGAMDGAMKFVRGDTMAGIAITCINLILGIILGVTRDGLAVGEAFAHYGTMTIGDGLCSQIPSLLTAVSAGLMVTRVPGDGARMGAVAQTLGRELGRGRGRWFEVAAGLTLLGLLPGLPLLPFLGVAAACLGVGLALPADALDESAASRSIFEDEAVAKTQEARDRLRLLPPSPSTNMVIEVGARLSEALLGDDEGASFAAELQLAGVLMFERRGVATWQTGVRLAARRLGSNEVRIHLYHHEIVRSYIPLNMVWSFTSSLREEARELALERWPHPISGAEIGGFSDARLLEGQAPITVGRRVAMLALGVAWERAGVFVRLGPLQRALNALDEDEPGLVDAVLPERLSLAEFCGAMQRLASEGYHVGRLEVSLSALASAPLPARLEPAAALRCLRVAHGGEYLSARMRGGVLYVWVFPRELLAQLDDELQRGPLDAARWCEALRALGVKPSQREVLVCPPEGREMVRELAAMSGLPFDVVGMDEVPRGMEMIVLGMVYARPSQVLEVSPGGGALPAGIG